MKLFACSSCREVVYFDNSRCTHCGHALAYVAEHAVMTALEPIEKGTAGLFAALNPKTKGTRYRMCGNHVDHGACNWAVAESDTHRFCRACRLNEIIPDLSDAKAKDAWLKLERSKRRLVYSLLELGLPVAPRSEDPRGVAFAFKKDVPGEEKVLIGHDEGLITINVAEADSPFREKTRIELGETYRTILGHFRHEIGHYYWDRLVRDAPSLEPFRGLFGDEQASYEEAVAAHYRDGAPKDWRTQFVSSYASMHPWEDWAESWAHYLHMVDTLDTARSFGLAVRSTVGSRGDKKVEVVTRRLDFDDFDDISQSWTPLTIALNSLNQSMGLPDLYPFVLPAPALRKIRFVHDLVERCGADVEKAA